MLLPIGNTNLPIGEISTSIHKNTIFSIYLTYFFYFFSNFHTNSIFFNKLLTPFANICVKN